MEVGFHVKNSWFNCKRRIKKKTLKGDFDT